MLDVTTYLSWCVRLTAVVNEVRAAASAEYPDSDFRQKLSDLADSIEAAVNKVNRLTDAD